MTNTDECIATLPNDYVGLCIVRPELFTDARGRLSVFEHEQNLDFLVRRTFFLEFPDVSSGNLARAEHATSCNQLIVTLHGSIRLELNNGTSHCLLTGTPRDIGFLIAAGVWRKIFALERNTLVMVLADASYADTSYFPIPVPELIRSFVRSPAT